MLTFARKRRWVARCRPRGSALGTTIVSALLLGAVLGVGPAAGQSQVTFVPSAELIGCSDTLYVDLVVDEQMTDLRGFSFVLGFDPGVIEPLVVVPGSLLINAGESYFFQWLNPQPGESTIEVDASVFGGAIEGPGPIIVMAFVGVESGESPLTEISGTMRDGENQNIPYVLPDGLARHLCTELSFFPPDAAIDCDESITIDLIVDEDVAELTYFSLEVTYDPSIIQPYDAALGSLLADAPCGSFFNWHIDDPMAGTIVIEGGLDGCNVSGPGVIAQISFGGEADGDSALDCAPGGLLQDAQGDTIPFECAPASLTNLCPIAVEQISWQRVKAMYR